MKRTAIIIACLLLGCGTALASGDGGTHSPFSFGVGAHELSLGGANLALSDFITAPYWNPARLVQAERYTLGIFHSRLYETGVAYQYFGLVAPTLDFGTFGVGVFRLGIDGIERRDDGNVLLGYTADKRLGFYLAYGRALSGYDLGVAVTTEYHSLDQYSATSSPGLNLSLSRRFAPSYDWLQQVTVAVHGRNLIRPAMDLVDQNVSYPCDLDAGISFGVIPKEDWNHHLTVSARVNASDGGDARLAFGMEYDLGEVLHLRGGINRDKFSIGAGMQFRLVSFDYALVDRDMGGIHMFTLSTAFGTSTNEKRRIRAGRREEDFNAMMHDQLTARNQEMVDQVVAQGKQHQEQGNIAEASRSFDRALFLARTNGFDTTQIFAFAVSARTRLDKIDFDRRIAQYIGSSQTAFDDGDYLAARYFANLALAERPGLAAAQDYLAQANAALDRISSRDEMLQRRLWEVDSLLSYGLVGQALASARTLEQFAPDHEAVKSAVKRAEFGQWRETASAAYSAGNFTAARNALSSALALFPGHQWCLELRRRIVDESRKTPVVEQVDSSPQQEPLSAELLKEVNVAYQAAQKAFIAGNLEQAIAQWEKVERIAPGYQSVREYLVNAYRFVGVELYGQNRLDEAVDVWRKALQMAPDNGEISDYLRRTETEIQNLRDLSYEQ